jgi:hypothetical protein
MPTRQQAHLRHSREQWRMPADLVVDVVLGVLLALAALGLAELIEAVLGIG